MGGRGEIEGLASPALNATLTRNAQSAGAGSIVLSCTEAERPAPDHRGFPWPFSDPADSKACVAVAAARLLLRDASQAGHARVRQVLAADPRVGASLGLDVSDSDSSTILASSSVHAMEKPASSNRPWRSRTSPRPSPSCRMERKLRVPQ